MRVTLDTNVVDDEPLVALIRKKGWDVHVISVSNRETEDSPYASHSLRHPPIAEIAVWDESRYDEAAYSGDEAEGCFEKALAIIGGGSFPATGKRDQLSPGQRRQLRDAMIFCTHVREKREVLVTNDKKGFIDRGKREAFEAEFATRILTSEEFLSEFGQSVV